MKFSEVQELLKAGFTADEIRSMLNPQNPQDFPQQENTNIPENTSENSSENNCAQAGYQLSIDLDRAGAPAENTNDPKFDQLNATMEKLIKTIQSSNLNNSSFNSVSEPDINTKVDQIMASIIRPEREKGGND